MKMELEELSIRAENSSETVFNNSDIIITSKPCEILCSKCNDIVILQNSSQREDVKTFLSKSFEGRRVLANFQHNKELTENALSRLTRLIIERECKILCDEKNASVENPLKKLAIPSSILTQLALDCAEIFKELPGTFYVATKTVRNGDETKKIQAHGRFVNRVTHMRNLLTDDGLMKKKSTDENSVENQQPETIDEALKFLRNHDDSDSESIKAAWGITYYARRELSKKDSSGVLWQWRDFSSLRENRDLILLDFEKKYETFSNVADTWPPFRNCFLKYIDSRRLDDESLKLVNNIETLTSEEKDEVLVSILPAAILAPVKPKTARKTIKRAKLDTDEVKNAKLADRETFVANLSDDSDVDSFILSKFNQTVKGHGPYIVVVGSLTQPSRLYTVIGTVKYLCQSVPEAFELAVKIYLAFKIPYPAKSSHAWVFLQKLVLRINKEDDKLLQTSRKALSFFTYELGVSCE